VGHKLKNYNRSTAHRKSMFKNLCASFEKHGHVTTTLAKAKKLKSLLDNNSEQGKISILRIKNRKGDNASLAKIVSERYIKKLNEPKKKRKKKNAKANKK
jgi:ribosomal protein L17